MYGLCGEDYGLLCFVVVVRMGGRIPRMTSNDQKVYSHERWTLDSWNGGRSGAGEPESGIEAELDSTTPLPKSSDDDGDDLELSYAHTLEHEPASPALPVISCFTEIDESATEDDEGIVTVYFSDAEIDELESDEEEVDELVVPVPGDHISQGGFDDGHLVNVDESESKDDRMPELDQDELSRGQVSFSSSAAAARTAQTDGPDRDRHEDAGKMGSSSGSGSADSQLVNELILSDDAITNVAAPSPATLSNQKLSPSLSLPPDSEHISLPLPHLVTSNLGLFPRNSFVSSDSSSSRKMEEDPVGSHSLFTPTPSPTIRSAPHPTTLFRSEDPSRTKEPEPLPSGPAPHPSQGPAQMVAYSRESSDEPVPVYDLTGLDDDDVESFGEIEMIVGQSTNGGTRVSTAASTSTFASTTPRFRSRDQYRQSRYENISVAVPPRQTTTSHAKRTVSEDMAMAEDILESSREEYLASERTMLQGTPRRRKRTRIFGGLKEGASNESTRMRTSEAEEAAEIFVSSSSSSLSAQMGPGRASTGSERFTDPACFRTGTAVLPNSKKENVSVDAHAGSDSERPPSLPPPPYTWHLGLIYRKVPSSPLDNMVECGCCSRKFFKTDIQGMILHAREEHREENLYVNVVEMSKEDVKEYLVERRARRGRAHGTRRSRSHVVVSPRRFACPFSAVQLETLIMPVIKPSELPPPPQSFSSLAHEPTKKPQTSNLPNPPVLAASPDEWRPTPKIPRVRIDEDLVTDAIAAKLATSLLGHILFLKNQIPFPVSQLARLPDGKANSRTTKLKRDLIDSFDILSSHLETTFSALSTAFALSSRAAASDPVDQQRGSQVYMAILVGPSIGTSKSKVFFAVDGLETKIWGVRDDIATSSESDVGLEDDGHEDQSSDSEDADEILDDDGDDASEPEYSDSPPDSEDEDEGEGDEDESPSSSGRSSPALLPPRRMPSSISTQDHAQEQKSIRSADQLLSRTLAIADAEGRGMASELAPTQTHVLLRAPRRFAHPVWIPRPNFTPSMELALRTFLEESQVLVDPSVESEPKHKNKRTTLKDKIEGVWLSGRGYRLT
ncbi:hypothetical protein D9757_010624 [Collybiopsis confluens]|uniref:Uncharacterized protein n=1 Tax=Collybiopsis confluens TaxID=2823264 RepID=A0A8H5GS98_9AGAR|nr:hypothetical protein D9757_010624 [Collybiopsis confluens]